MAKALQGLLDHSMEQDHRLEQLQREVEALKARTEDDPTVADGFDPGRVSRQAEE
jgi:serine O-acetyltransferase